MQVYTYFQRGRRNHIGYKLLKHFYSVQLRSLSIYVKTE